MNPMFDRSKQFQAKAEPRLQRDVVEASRALQASRVLQRLYRPALPMAPAGDKAGPPVALIAGGVVAVALIAFLILKRKK